VSRLARTLGRTSAVAMLFVVALTAVVGGGADAQPVLTGPTVTLDKNAAAVGEKVRVSLSGFEASYVTVSVCGNEARRGSSDCSTTGSTSVEVHHDGTETWTVFSVPTPPFGCPCAIRVFSSLNDEVAITPFTVTGHPVEPVQGGRDLSQPLVSVSVTAESAPDGMVESMRSSLGGPATYAVTVSVKNLTTDELSKVALSGSVGRSERDELALLELIDPGHIGPGQTSTQTVTVKLPSPTYGTFVWRATATGAGPAVTTTSEMQPRPWLLILAILAVVAIIAMLVIRYVVHRRVRRDAERASVTQLPDGSAQGDAVLHDHVAAEDGVAHAAA
jgi:hypothetical protein